MSDASAPVSPGTDRADEGGELRFPPPRPYLGAPGAMLVVISGPSGVGKDAVIGTLERLHPDRPYHHVVTCTTRKPRVGEEDRIAYHFLSPDEYREVRDRGMLLEASRVHEDHYGTPLSEVGEAIEAGRHAILKIDVQGARAVRARVPESLLIFIVPPSLAVLDDRRRRRATESEEAFRIRQEDAEEELAASGELYDYRVLNETGQLQRAAEEIDHIIAHEAARRADHRIQL
jgi:guanylate kinase